MFLLLKDRWWLRNLLTENVPLDEVRKPNMELVTDELFRWNREDLCKQGQ